MEKLIRAAIQSALDFSALESAIYESIAAEIEEIDYEFLAEAILEDFDIPEMAAEEARKIILPF